MLAMCTYNMAVGLQS